MSQEFNVGDQVMLKSGGPVMTIASIADYYGVTKAVCEWFDSKHTPHEKPFALTSLIPYN